MTFRAHIGALVTAVLLACAMVVSSWYGWRSTYDASLEVARTRAVDNGVALAREVRRASGKLPERLDAAFLDLQDRGVTAVTLVHPRRREIVARVGSSTMTDSELLNYVAEAPRGHYSEWVGDRVRAVTRVPVGRRRGRRAERRGGFPPDGPEPRGRRLVVLEFSPTLAVEMRERGDRQLTLGIAAAALLALLALLFHRATARARRAEAGLAREKHLAALGEMSAVLGHEIKNPLASLKGHAQWLTEVVESGHPGRTSAETVVREAIRLQTLTEQILDFVRTGAVQPRPVAPGAVLHAAVGRLDGVTVEMEDTMAPAHVTVDPERIGQVFDNLLDNARQSTPPGGTVHVTSAASSGAWIVTIRDEGVGVPDAELEAIFDPFRTGRVRGTGLGLAICRRIVEAHGGTIEVKNAPVGGAVFAVRLPEVPVVS